MKKLLFCLILTLSCSAFGQTTAPQPTPKTEIETFAGQSGRILIKGYTEIGKVTGLNGTVAVNALEFTDATTKVKVTGISFEVKESGRLSRENVSFIEMKEIDGLLKGIDYLSKVTKGVTVLDNFEAVFRTKGDFVINAFSNSEGKTDIAVQSGIIGKSTVFISLENLAALKELITTAKSKLA